MSALIATVFGVGRLHPASGTWGSAAALPMFWVLHVLGGFPLVVGAALLVFLLGWWASANYTRGAADHDPSEVVIDEVVGQWIALFPISFGAWRLGQDILALYPGWIFGFLLFRLFDIWKPGPIGWADRRGDALGLMLDDVFAGIFAALWVVFLAAIAHGLFA